MLFGFSVLASFSTLWPNEAHGPGLATPAVAAISRSREIDCVDALMTVETFNAIHEARLSEPHDENPASDSPHSGAAFLDPPRPHLRGLDTHMPTPDFSAPSVEDRNRMMIENARLEQLSGRPGTITNPGIPDFERMARDLSRKLQSTTQQTRAALPSAPL